MTLAQFLFYSFSTVIILSSLLAVTTRRILRAAVFLLFALAATAGIYFLVGYLFLAAVQVIVYAGGIVVLIIFSILLTSEIGDQLPAVGVMKVVGSFLVVVLGLTLTLGSILSYNFPGKSELPLNLDMRSIGGQLLNYGDGGYALPFELISILLLAAMVAAIIIAKNKKPEADD